MMTGQFRFATQLRRPKWFSRMGKVQVLLVEVDEPIDAAGNRATYWREATLAERHNFEARVAYLKSQEEVLRGDIAVLRTRLEGIAEAASRP